MTRLNTHMTHFEDLVLFGQEGLDELEYKIDNMLDDSINYTYKVDGAPSVFMWSHFEGYPDNSICLKSFTKNANNVLSSRADIIDKYGDRKDMCDKLLHCLDLAISIPYGEAWQGDCLYTDNTLKQLSILGTEYITFQPNKIIYAVNELSPAYEKIVNSTFGICFHTIYTGNLDSKRQSFKVNLNRLKNVSRDTYIMTPTLNKPTAKLDSITMLAEKFKYFKGQLENNPVYEELLNNPIFIKYWNLFENKYISDKAVITLDLNTFEEDLHNFVAGRLLNEYDKKQATLKTDKGKEKAKSTYDLALLNLDDLIHNDRDVLRTLVECLNTAAEIKMEMLKLFPKKGDFNTFFNSLSRGYIPTDGEGSAMSDQDGNVVKLVDRSTFSNANRSDDFVRGFSEELNEKLGKPKKTAVVAFGRLNPPTLGHLQLVKTLELEAMKNNADPLLFLSHSCDKKKNPLDYDTKLKYCQEAFKHIDVVNSPAKTLVNVLEELNNEYTDIIYVCGSDRLQGQYSTDKVLLAYNDKPDKSGKINYSYNSINFVSAGTRDEESGDKIETISASKARQLASEGNFEEFEAIIPFEGEKAKQLFNDTRKGLGLNALNEDLSHTDINRIRNQIIDEVLKIDGVELMGKSNVRHPAQLFRIKITVNNPEQVVAKVEDILKNISLDYPYSFIEYSQHSEASGKFNSFKILLDGIDYYIVVSNKISKELTPVKLMTNINGKSIEYNKMANYIDYQKDEEINDFLKLLANESVQKVSSSSLSALYDNLMSGESNDIDFEFVSDEIKNAVNSIDPDKFKLIKSGLEVDYAEIYGATAFATVISQALSQSTYVQYPSKSNERLIDYTIIPAKLPEIRVSAKTKTGARPSSVSMFESIRDLLNKGFTDSSLAEGINFSSWFMKEYLSKGVDDGYSFLAEVMVDIVKGNGPKWSAELDRHSEFKTISECLTGKLNMNKCLVLREACNSILSGYSGSAKLNLPDKRYEEHLEKYVVRCLGTVLVTLINNSVIIDQVNILFRLSYGSLVQVYAFPKFETGEFKFKAKWVTGENHEYMFSYNIGLDGASGMFKNNKLAVVAK